MKTVTCCSHARCCCGSGHCPQVTMRPGLSQGIWGSSWAGASEPNLTGTAVTGLATGRGSLGSQNHRCCEGFQAEGFQAFRQEWSGCPWTPGWLQHLWGQQDFSVGHDTLLPFRVSPRTRSSLFPSFNWLNRPACPNPAFIPGETGQDVASLAWDCPLSGRPGRGGVWTQEKLTSVAGWAMPSERSRWQIRSCT